MSREIVNALDSYSSNDLLGWVARTLRLSDPRTEHATLTSFAKGRNGYPSVPTSLLTMLELGDRSWTANHVHAYCERLGPRGNRLREAFLSSHHRRGNQFLSSRECAEAIDSIAFGDPVSMIELSEAVQWALTRKDPLGRSSWERIVDKVVSTACDSKGRPGIRADILLADLASHPETRSIVFDHALQVASEVGHPTSFVPQIALQAPGSKFDAPALVREIESPTNRWLIREYLNLASAKVHQNSRLLAKKFDHRLAASAHLWLVDTSSEHEVRRAAAHLLVQLNQTPRLTFIKRDEDLGTILLAPHHRRLITTPERRMVVTACGDTPLGKHAASDTVLRNVLSNAIHSTSDEERRNATRWLACSGYREAVNEVALRRIDSSTSSETIGTDKAWIRLAGKTGRMEDAATPLIRLAACHTIEPQVREVALWALSDLSSPSDCGEALLDASNLLFSPQVQGNETLERAVVSTLGKHGSISLLTALDKLAPNAQREAIWWRRNRPHGTST